MPEKIHQVRVKLDAVHVHTCMMPVWSKSRLAHLHCMLCTLSLAAETSGLLNKWIGNYNISNFVLEKRQHYTQAQNKT